MIKIKKTTTILACLFAITALTLVSHAAQADTVKLTEKLTTARSCRTSGSGEDRFSSCTIKTQGTQSLTFKLPLATLSSFGVNLNALTATDQLQIDAGSFSFNTALGNAIPANKSKLKGAWSKSVSRCQKYKINKDGDQVCALSKKQKTASISLSGSKTTGLNLTVSGTSLTTEIDEEVADGYGETIFATQCSETGSIPGQAFISIAGRVIAYHFNVACKINKNVVNVGINSVSPPTSTNESIAATDLSATSAVSFNNSLFDIKLNLAWKNAVSTENLTYDVCYSSVSDNLGVILSHCFANQTSPYAISIKKKLGKSKQGVGLNAFTVNYVVVSKSASGLWAVSKKASVEIPRSALALLMVSGEGLTSNAIGYVTDGGSIQCGQKADDHRIYNVCNAQHVVGTEVTLTATPVANAKLVNWDGQCSGNASTCKVIIKEGVNNVNATFGDASINTIDASQIPSPTEQTGSGSSVNTEPAPTPAPTPN